LATKGATWTRSIETTMDAYDRLFPVWTSRPRAVSTGPCEAAEGLGHFAALEEPQLLAQEIREFFWPLRRAPNDWS
jgi:pimeloyl-ACP methyl ester carboxylesterase